MKRVRAVALHATGRRLHQLATLEMLDDAYRITYITSPSDSESRSARDRYLVPQSAAIEKTGSIPVTVTHIVDEVTFSSAGQDGSIVVLIPPLTITSSLALRDLIHTPRRDVRCAPPMIRSLHERVTSVNEIVPRATILALSTAGNLDSALLGRALWAMTSAQWMSRTRDIHVPRHTQAPAKNLRLEVANDIIQVSDPRITGEFEIADMDFEGLTFIGASGKKVQDPKFTADHPSFIVHAVSWPLLHPSSARKFAYRYLGAWWNSVEPLYHGGRVGRIEAT